MYRDDYFDNHPVYNLLSYDVIVGIIQLMIDEGLVDPKERDGIYVHFKDFRDKVREVYRGMSEEQKQEYIKYFRYKHHLFQPFPNSNDGY